MEDAKEEISMGLSACGNRQQELQQPHIIFFLYPENPKNKTLDNGWHHWAGGKLLFSEAANHSCSEFTKIFSN